VQDFVSVLLCMMFIPLSLFLSIGLFQLAQSIPAISTSCHKLDARQEWRSLSVDQRAAWVSSVKCLASIRHQRLSSASQGRLTEVHGSHSLYDDFSFAHSAMDKTAHFNPYFLPWHRWFLYLFDTRLRETCGYNGPTPYWDWTKDAESLATAPVFDPDPMHGLGQSGDCSSSRDCALTSGALLPPEFVLAFPIPHPLRRNLSMSWDETPSRLHNATLGAANVQNVIGDFTKDYFRFQFNMTHMHNHVHNFVGGDLAGLCPAPIEDEGCGSFTPNDPIFWLHHAQLDRLWSNWQNASPENFDSFSGVPLNSHNLTDTRYDLNATADHLMGFDRLSVGVRVSEVFDHQAPPFCYLYE